MAGAPVALLHTAAVHVEAFAARVRALDPQQVLLQAVDEHLLARALALQGPGDPRSAGVRADLGLAMARLARQGAQRVMCTCSTLGAWAESVPMPTGCQAFRVDRAMAEAALSLGPRPLVVVALASTVAPTLALLHAVAAERQQVLQPELLAVPAAWQAFMAGDPQRYLTELRVAVARRLAAAGAGPSAHRGTRDGEAPALDSIVLAQASMAALADQAPAASGGWAAGLPVLCSPGLGVRALLGRADG